MLLWRKTSSSSFWVSCATYCHGLWKLLHWWLLCWLMDKYGDLSFLFGSCFDVIIGFVLFVMFVFSPVFFIFGFDYSFVWNTYPGLATRLGGFSGDPILADCELYNKFHWGEQCWQCSSCLHGSLCTKDQGLSSTPVWFVPKLLPRGCQVSWAI